MFDYMAPAGNAVVLASHDDASGPRWSAVRRCACTATRRAFWICTRRRGKSVARARPRASTGAMYLAPPPSVRLAPAARWRSRRCPRRDALTTAGAKDGEALRADHRHRDPARWRSRRYSRRGRV